MISFRNLAESLLLEKRLVKSPQENDSVVNFVWFYVYKLIVLREILQKE